MGSSGVSAGLPAFHGCHSDVAYAAGSGFLDLLQSRANHGNQALKNMRQFDKCLQLNHLQQINRKGWARVAALAPPAPAGPWGYTVAKWSSASSRPGTLLLLACICVCFLQQRAYSCMHTCLWSLLRWKWCRAGSTLKTCAWTTLLGSLSAPPKVRLYPTISGLCNGSC